MLENLGLQVPRGSLYGFLGPNGAGKTTTLRLLPGLLWPDAGEVRLFGERLDEISRQRLLARVGVMAEMPPGYPKLTGAQNLAVVARLLGVKPRRIDEVLEQVGLRDAANKPFSDYSLGMRQRLSLAFALLGRPQLLVLDEPTNGLDPAGVEDLRRLLRTLCAGGTTVLMSSHQLAEVEQLASHVGVLHHGHLLFQGPLAELHAAQPAVLDIGVEEILPALTCLQSAGWTAQLGTTSIEVTLREPSDAARINRQLHLAGFGVHHLTLRRPTLESLFLALTVDRICS